MALYGFVILCSNHRHIKKWITHIVSMPMHFVQVNICARGTDIHSKIKRRDKQNRINVLRYSYVFFFKKNNTIKDYQQTIVTICKYAISQLLHDNKTFQKYFSIIIYSVILSQPFFSCAYLAFTYFSPYAVRVVFRGRSDQKGQSPRAAKFRVLDFIQYRDLVRLNGRNHFPPKMSYRFPYLPT